MLSVPSFKLTAPYGLVLQHRSVQHYAYRITMQLRERPKEKNKRNGRGEATKRLRKRKTRESSDVMETREKEFRGGRDNPAPRMVRMEGSPVSTVGGAEEGVGSTATEHAKELVGGGKRGSVVAAEEGEVKKG